MRYFIDLSFDGGSYCGWQVQPHSPTVQGTLADALRTILRTEVNLIGAGRTDTGVHAKRMIAHFDASEPLDASQLTYRLNKLLPQTIAVRSIVPVSAELHARFSATERTYHYFLHTAKDPFLRDRSWFVSYPLRFDLMNEAARLLIGRQDFGSFAKSGADTKTNLCDVRRAVWEEIQQGHWRFTITADRFLRNMVRAVVGTLVEVGRERLSIEQFRLVIDMKDRGEAGESVPPQGLYLADVQYPEPLFEPYEA